VVLDVLSHNEPAIALYRRLGYTEFHRQRAYYVETPLQGRSPSLPDSYRLAPVDGRAARLLARLVRASLPPAVIWTLPGLARTYVDGPPALAERVRGAQRSRRWALRDGERVAGLLAARMSADGPDGRIGYPIISREDTSAVAGAVVEAAGWLARQGARTVRLDLSEDRADQHEVVTAAGWQHRWTFVQMAHELERH
jgi:hypothetical protein